MGTTMRLKISKEQEAFLINTVQTLLQFDTAHPRGQTLQACLWLQETLASVGIEAQVFEAAPGKANLFATVPGKATQALLLSSHLDTVPVVGSPQYPAGTLENGRIFGRGAVDMKFKTALDLLQLIRAKEEGRSKTFNMVVVCDEEISGPSGVRWMAEYHRRLLDSEYVLNEVGGFPLLVGNQLLFPIQTGERAANSVTLTLRSQGGHAALESSKTEGILPAIAQIISELPDFFLWQDHSFALKIPEAQLKAGVAAGVLPWAFLGSQGTTATITGVRSGASGNMVPSDAGIFFDLREFPGESSALEKLQEFVATRIAGTGVSAQWRVKRLQPAYQISRQLFAPFLAHVEEVLPHFLSAQIVDYCLPASSDNSFYASIGLCPIGFSPLLFEQNDPGFFLAHTENESVSVEALLKGADLYCAVLDRWGV